MPRPDNAVLGGFPCACLGFREVPTYEPRLRVDHLFSPGGFAARVSASGTTGDRCPDRETIFLAADTAFASVFAAPSVGRTGSAEAMASVIHFVQLAPSLTSTTKGAESNEIADPAASAPLPPGPLAPPLPVHCRAPAAFSTRTRRRTAAATGAASRAVDHGFGPGGVPLPPVWRADTTPRAPRPRQSFRPLLLPSHQSRLHPFRLTVTEPTLWEPPL